MKLLSPLASPARFGTTLSRLGDINHDGFNDIAVGAPFAGNGSVFIYLGSKQGLRSQHSQRLDAPSQQPPKYGPHMFGHGLSKGSDIDQNGFNDFAIGAPNAESVYLYRAYPVVKLQASLRLQSREIKPEQNKVQITACYGLTTTATMASTQQQELDMRIVIDPQLKRVNFAQTQSHELSFKAYAGSQQQCRNFECDVRYSEKDIFQPIELEMHYELAKKIPDSEEFCTTCVVVDPDDPKVFREKIIISTGCAKDICIADLQLDSKDVSPSFTLGSANILCLNYEITNIGETAYLPQIKVSSLNRLRFAEIPWNCKDNEAIMVCDLNSERPLAKGDKDSISICFNVTNLVGSELIIKAEVSSTGHEENSKDNNQTNVISLMEYTEIDATGGQTNDPIDLQHHQNSADIINNYKIRSNGPSTIDALELVLHIPVAYKIAGSTATIPIINVSNLTLQASYDAQVLDFQLLDQNNTQLIMNPVEMSQKVATAAMTRKRRDLKALPANRGDYVDKAHDLLSEDFQGKLPANRTILFNCSNPEITICVRAVIRVYHFKPEKTVNLNMRFSVDLNEVNARLMDPWQFFVILIDLNVRKDGDPLAKTLSIKRKIDPNVIFKQLVSRMAIWIIIVSVLGGLLLLAGMIYGMYKLGFFKRAKKEELERLVQQKRGACEAENLNSEDN